MLANRQPACCTGIGRKCNYTNMYAKSVRGFASFSGLGTATDVAAASWPASCRRSPKHQQFQRKRLDVHATAEQSFYNHNHSNNNSSTSIPVTDYLQPGPHSSLQLPLISFTVGQGKTGPLECSLRVTVPQAAPHAPSPPSGRWPLLLLSAGFLLHSGLYGSYGRELASWGLAVALYDIPELLDDVTMVNTLGCIIDTCMNDPRVAPYIDPRVVLLAGHSRGGKLSVLAAAGDPRVKGVALLDPVDVTAMTPAGPGYPSALPAMRIACSPPRRMPVLVVGAARNTDVIPADANYRRFVSSCPGPCWSLELLGAGHLQFLDARVELLSMFVGSGSTPDEAVRRVSRAAMAVWARELAVPLARGEPVGGQQVTERLRQASAALEQLAPLSYSVKGFDHLGAPGSFTYGSSSRGDAGKRTSSSSGGDRDSSSSSSKDGSSSSESGSGAGGGAAAAGAHEEGRSGATGSSFAGPSASAAAAGASGAGGGSRLGGWSREQLQGMRARELKALLQERGVECSDCFEKEDLVRRILERC
ncbi:hypothetical protein Agub_g9265 [Astrephomene gubernaculifera]|uniref:ARMET C-terminal domain-containing protein n=1 Tax=Astrephomene gubernaculifera TaxID=47775 RepID=A0AAD3DVS7_9CHLO|nr:hypothetical protein Agub_g9265 [Astrephomene gubernaculifera]